DLHFEVHFLPHNDSSACARSRVCYRGAHPEVTLDRRDYQRHGAEDDEHQVAGQAQPFDQTRPLTPDVVKAAGVPVSMLDHVPNLQHATGEQAHRHHHREADVSAPECELDVFLSA